MGIDPAEGDIGKALPWCRLSGSLGMAAKNCMMGLLFVGMIACSLASSWLPLTLRALPKNSATCNYRK